MPSLFRIIAAAALALLAIAPRNAAGSSFGAQIGWLEGGCLAVPNAAIAPGASATFLLFDPERAEGDVPSALLVPGAILRKAAPSTSCAAPPVEVNGAEPDWTLYEVEIEKVHTPSRAKGLGLLAVGRHIDLDGNGETESFGICRTENGVRLDIWSDGLGRGDRLGALSCALPPSPVRRLATPLSFSMPLSVALRRKSAMSTSVSLSRTRPSRRAPGSRSSLRRTGGMRSGNAC